MLRALAPSLIVAMLVTGGAGLFYGLDGPAWIVYAAIVPAVLSVLPARNAGSAASTRGSSSPGRDG